MTDSDEEDTDHAWLLGYLESPNDRALLLRHRFPSKVGGAPAWLNPEHLPAKQQLECPHTGQPMRFLLQLYAAPPAGSDEDHAGAFHRSLLVFLSPQGSRLDAPGAVAALRCQLPLHNAYYDSEPSDALLPRPLPADVAERSLAADPWKVVQSERDLKRPCGGVTTSPPLLKEWEILVEPEAASEAGNSPCSLADLCVDKGTSAQEDAPSAAFAGAHAAGDGAQASSDALSSKLGPAALKERVDRYKARVAQEGEIDDGEAGDIDEAFREQISEEDRLWAHFQTVTSEAPGSVLRYCIDSGAEPLWARLQPRPDSAPPCPRCGAARRFEVQILPQLLHYLDIDDASEDAPDWATVVIYTCSRSCVPEDGVVPEGESAAYASEYVLVQPAFQSQAVT